MPSQLTNHQPASQEGATKMSSNQPTVSNQPETAGGAPAFIQSSVRFLLKSPLHRFMSKNTMLLNFAGRKSGKAYSVPVTYVEDGSETIFCTTDSKWWRNLEGGAPVTLRVRGRNLSGTAEVSSDPAAIAEAIRRILQKSPRDAYAYLIKLDEQGQIKPDELARAVAARKLITVKLNK